MKRNYNPPKITRPFEAGLVLLTPYTHQIVLPHNGPIVSNTYTQKIECLDLDNFAS